ncbi:Csu type fimbrial protein [Cobetia sp. L2A1]|uniref:Csu type fimbrial protein n=1 Tax=Cobetia sp. L2A1 TaxID=2686360 RepID=UPI00131DB22D|nr:spore coat U domain-containing protein [Cobetia sp. L2A1]
MKASSRLAMILMGCCGLWSTPAFSAITCTVSATGVAFGVYDPLSGNNLDSTGSLTVTCTRQLLDSRSVRYSVALSSGSSGSTTARTMVSGTYSLAYNLYTNAARTTTWGGTNTPEGTVSFTPILGLLFPTPGNPMSIYGRIFGSQLVPAGAYSDTITATVLY